MRRFRIEFVLAIAVVPAQAPAAALHGIVRDPQDQPVARSRVILFARDHTEQITSITDSQGEYSVQGLAGEYLAQAESPGLARSTAKTVTLAGNVDVALDFTLGLAKVRTEVLVTATGAPQSTDEIAKAVDLLRGSELAKNVEFTATDSLRSAPGMQV